MKNEKKITVADKKVDPWEGSPYGPKDTCQDCQSWNVKWWYCVKFIPAGPCAYFKPKEATPKT